MQVFKFKGNPSVRIFFRTASNPYDSLSFIRKFDLIEVPEEKIFLLTGEALDDKREKLGQPSGTPEFIFQRFTVIPGYLFKIHRPHLTLLNSRLYCTLLARKFQLICCCLVRSSEHLAWRSVGRTERAVQGGWAGGDQLGSFVFEQNLQVDENLGYGEEHVAVRHLVDHISDDFIERSWTIVFLYK